jgi:hypothetical protein
MTPADDFTGSEHSKAIAALLQDAKKSVFAPSSIRHRASVLGQSLNGLHRDRLFSAVDAILGRRDAT